MSKPFLQTLNYIRTDDPKYAEAFDAHSTAIGNLSDQIAQQKKQIEDLQALVNSLLP